MMVRVALPYPLQMLASVASEVQVEVPGVVTPRAILDALEARYPALKGTIRDPQTGHRRPYLRFYACLQDFSHADPDAVLPAEVASGIEPFTILASIAGG
ncbi:MAG: MoaD/ThiS family protein [Chthonomonadales bacterium]